MKIWREMQIKVARKNDSMYSRISTNGHLSTPAIFLANSPYIHFCFNLSTTATFFCPQGGRYREVQR